MSSRISKSPPTGWQIRQETMRQAARETTAHGVAQTVSDRHWTLRLFWLAAFLAMIGLLFYLLVDAVRKVRMMPTTTSVEPNTAEFVFPDVHICSYPMVSASYSATMSPADVTYAEQQMTTIAKLLKMANVNDDEINKLATLAFVGTVPYSFLSRNFGMRMEQSFIGATVMPVTVNLNLSVDITNLRHYKFLNCFTVRVVSDPSMQSVLSNVMGYLEIALYADASYNQTLRLNNGTIDVRGLGFLNYEFLIGSGFRVYLTERGKYPDDYSASVAISPGFFHRISLSMTKTALVKEKQQCVSNMPNVKILDQVTNKPVEYAYSLGSCYATSMQKTVELLRCYIPGYFPILYNFKDTPSCTNLSSLVAAYNSSSTLNLAQISLMQMIYNGSMSKDMADAVQKMQTDCQNSKPCEELTYQPTVSSVLFPLKQGLTSELTSIFKTLTQVRTSSGFYVPGRIWMSSLFDSVFYNGTTNNTALDLLAIAGMENILRLHIQTTELTSTQLTQGISYALSDLAAGVGGLMGLFMGGSVLTLLEVIELCVFLCYGRRITDASAVEPGPEGGSSAASAAQGTEGQQSGEQQTSYFEATKY